MHKKEKKNFYFKVNKANLIKSILMTVLCMGILCVSAFVPDRIVQSVFAGIWIGLMFPLLFGITKYTWGAPFEKIQIGKLGDYW